MTDFLNKALHLYNVLMTRQYDVFSQVKLTLNNGDGSLSREFSVCLEKHDEDDDVDYVYHIVSSRRKQDKSGRLNSSTHRIDNFEIGFVSNELLQMMSEMSLDPMKYVVCNVTCKMFVVSEDAPMIMRDIIYRLTLCRKDPIVVHHAGMMTIFFEGLIL